MPERHETPGELTLPFSASDADVATTADASDAGHGQAEDPAASAVEAGSTASAWFTSWNAADTPADSDTTQAFDRRPVHDMPAQAPAPHGAMANGTAANGTASTRAAHWPAPSARPRPQPRVPAEPDEAPSVEPQLAPPPEPTLRPEPRVDPAHTQLDPAAQLPQEAGSPWRPATVDDYGADAGIPEVDSVSTDEPQTQSLAAATPLPPPPASAVSPWTSQPSPPQSGEPTSHAAPLQVDAPRRAHGHAPPPAGSGRPTDTGADDEPPAGPPLWRQRRILILAAVIGVLGLLYVADLVLSHGTVPRGVTVAGVNVGGMNPTEAEKLLRSTIQPRTTQPIPVRAGDVQATIDPRTTGLQISWDRTLENVNAQPLNPWTRLITLFSDRQVGVTTTGDPNALAGAITQLVPTVDRPPVEGNVRFEGTTPLPVEPKPGYRLDQSTAADVLRRDWVSGAPVVLPMLEDQPTTTNEAVKTAIEQVATPAVSAPFTIAGEKGMEAEIAATVTASALHFVPDGSGGLRPDIETARIVAAAEPQLESTEQPGRDASLALQDGKPVVTPSVDGRGIDFDVTLKPLVDVLRRPTDRRLVATYGPQPAKLTTEDVNRLGITDVIGEFTTSGFAADSGINIRRAAQAINGTVLKPGETFSLNGATGLRNASTGYVEAGIIEDNHPARGIGGGVSQLATTTYNAAYFAGMTDVTHTEHSFYISRYPAAREATVFEGAIDLKFRNDNPTGVLIQTVWTPSTITVRLYGAKRYVVTSTPGPRINPTDPGEVTIPAGQPCSPSNGSPGFTTSDTRTMRDIKTGETKSHTRNVTYKPAPKVICGS